MPDKAGKPEELVARLEHALVRQAQAIRAGKWSDLEKALADGQYLVEQIQTSRLVVSDQDKERLMNQYRTLILIAKANMSCLDAQISSIRRGRTLAGTYKDDRSR